LDTENGRHEDYNGLQSPQPERVSIGWPRSQKFLCDLSWSSWSLKVCTWLAQACKSNCTLGNADDSWIAKEGILWIQVFGLWLCEFSSCRRLLCIYYLRLCQTSVFCIHRVENSMAQIGLWNSLWMLWLRWGIRYEMCRNDWRTPDWALNKVQPIIQRRNCTSNSRRSERRPWIRNSSKIWWKIRVMNWLTWFWGCFGVRVDSTWFQVIEHCFLRFLLVFSSLKQVGSKKLWETPLSHYFGD